MKTYKDWIAAPGRDCAVIAHRGAWHEAPENSVAAIARAAALGCTVAEVDVRRTADGALVLLHDDTALRMTGVDLAPEEVTLGELRALRLRPRDGLGDQTATEHLIPTLEEALQAAKGRIFLDLDLKDRGIAPDVIACVKRAGAEGIVDLKFPVSSQAEARRLQEMQGESGIAMMAMTTFEAGSDDERRQALLTHAPFMVETKFDSAERLAANAAVLNRAGIAVWVNSLDVSYCDGFNDTNALADPDRIWGRLLAAGVSAIQTDEPEALISWLKSRKAAA
ncbi:MULTISPECIES: glycerophosphodiester phosphodiesterase family protein [unclassified Sinorhizobium]|uniref:glycerophosphodiester phosphodiesterase family protein n=1 Tax=unclassified Sinorhizobium TaxID=2613772 RepID=UPI003523CBAC